jgi:hypothetical protein
MDGNKMGLKETRYDTEAGFIWLSSGTFSFA